MSKNGHGGKRRSGYSRFGAAGTEFYRRKREARGKPYQYTGEKFLAASPARAKKCIEMIALGFPSEVIAAKLGCSQSTVRAVRWRCVEDIAKRKQELLQIVLPGSAVAAEKAIELLEHETEARNAAVVHGIFMDSIGKLTGGVTQRIEITGSIDIHARYDELNRQIAAKVEEMRAERASAPCEKTANVLELPQADGTGDSNDSNGA